VLDIRELIRRVQLGEPDRRIARDLQVSRKTVSKYRAWPQQHAVLTGPLPDAATLQAQLKTTLPESAPPATPSKVAPFRDQMIGLRQRGVECRAIFDILREQHAFAGSYGAVYRFVRHLEPRTPDACVRVERDPGEEAQVDFGYAGLLRDPASDSLRKAWAFVMTRSFSRHRYVEFVFAHPPTRARRRTPARRDHRDRPAERDVGHRCDRGGHARGRRGHDLRGDRSLHRRVRRDSCRASRRSLRSPRAPAPRCP